MGSFGVPLLPLKTGLRKLVDDDCREKEYSPSRVSLPEAAMDDSQDPPTSLSFCAGHHATNLQELVSSDG